MAETLELGELTVTVTDRTEPYSGRTPSRKEGEAVASVWSVEGEEVQASVVYLNWHNGERSVILTERFDSPEPLDRLARGLSFSIERKADFDFCELTQARIKDAWDPRSSNAFKATLEELDQGAGIPVSDALTRAGAIKITTKEALIGDSGRRRNFLAVSFPRRDQMVPVAAYALTRILPLARGVTTEDFD